MSWYTKRALVSKIYAATEVYMMQDTSDDHEATWEFLERRIENAMEVGKLVNSNSTLVNAVGGGIASIVGMMKPQKFDDSEFMKAKHDDKQK